MKGSGTGHAESRFGTRLSRLLKSIEGDRALSYVLLTRVWQSAAGVVGLLLIMTQFPPTLQGYYYTFASVIALQTFFELGVCIVILSAASHEWAHLRLSSDRTIEGDPAHLARLASLARVVLKWYLPAGTLFMIATSVAGIAFFSGQGNDVSVNWRQPWIMVVLFTGVAFMLTPVMVLLEGCNQVLEVNRVRLIQAVVASFGFWALLLAGAGLWATLALPAMTIVAGLYMLLGRYRRLFLQLFQCSGRQEINWRTELWPMQWRLAVQGVMNYFAGSLFNPVMFHYHGAEAAGRLGMTMQIASALQSLAQSGLQTRNPTFGILIARRDYAGLDLIFRRVAVVSLGFLIVASLCTWIALGALSVTDSRFADRVLQPFPAALLLLAGCCAHVVQCFAAYMRAHRREALAAAGVGYGILTGALVWWWGSTMGETGAAAATFVVTACYSLPLVTCIWYRSRASWHKE